MKKKAIGKASDQLALDFDAVSTTTEASGTTQDAQPPDCDGDARICVRSRSSITVEEGIPLTMPALDDAPVMPPRGLSLLAAGSDAAAVELGSKLVVLTKGGKGQGGRTTLAARIDARPGDSCCG